MGDDFSPLAALHGLRAAGRALADAPGLDEVLATLIEHALDRRAAAGAVVAVLGTDGELEPVAACYPENAARVLQPVDPSLSRALTDTIRTGDAVWAETVVGLPLRIGGRVVGGLAIEFSEQQEFDEIRRVYLLALADMCAMVLDRDVLGSRRSEDRLRALVESNVVGVIGGDITRILEANDAFLHMLGLDRSALVAGIDARNITPAAWREADRRVIELADATGRFGPYEKEFLHRDGHAVPVRMVGAVLSSEGRGRYIALVEDLSSDRAFQTELETSEARYRSLAEATNTIVWTSDWTGCFQSTDPSWTAYTGQSDAEAGGHGWLNAIHAEDRTRIFFGLDDARRARSVWNGRARLFQAASGRYREVVLRAVPMLDGNGGIGEWVGTVIDIDDQVRTGEVLRATTARLASLMRNAPVGFAFIDDQLRFQVVNDKLAEINGLSVEAHLGRDVREVVPDLAAVNETLFRRVLRGEPILETEVTGATPAAPGEPRDWLVNYYPVRDHAGSILGIGATVVDVTERNRLLLAERAARSAAERTAEFSEALSDVTTAIAAATDDEGIAQATGEHLLTTLHADAVLIARTDPDGAIEDVLFARGYPPEVVTAIRNDPSTGEWSSGDAITSRAPVYYEFPEAFLARFPSRAGIVERIGARAWTVVPLLAGDLVLGLMVAMFRTEHEFGPDERRFVATLSDVVAQSLLRARARAAEALARRSTEVLTEVLAAERTRLAAVLHRMPAGLVVVDATAHPRVVLSNQRAGEILGPPPPNDDPDAWFVLRDAEGSEIPLGRTPLHRALRGEEIAEAEDALVVRTDGTGVRVRTSAVPIRDGQHRVTSAVLVIEDVTEQARRERDARLLARVSDLLGTAGDVNEMLERVVALSVPSFADACGVYVLSGQDVHLLAVAHRDPTRIEEIRRHLARPIPAAELTTSMAAAVRRGKPILISAADADIERPDAPDAESRAAVRELIKPRAFLIVPLRTGERVTGAIIFCQTDETRRDFTSEDVEVAAELATRCALLLEQVAAHNETARARDRADRLQRFAAAMASAASVDAVVAAIATDGVTAVDAAVVNVTMRVEHEGSFEYVQTRRSSSSSSLDWHSVDPRANNALIATLHSGRPAFFRNRQEYLDEYPDSVETLDQNRVQAAACLPLYGSAGRVIGALGYAFDSEQRFDDGQRDLLATVAGVAAQSLDRARLYERERDVAGALQFALLPSALPELDDVATEARYVAGGAGVSVGGDWYDVLRFADGRVGLLIGDAAGRGVEAATLMGKVRHAAAALAMDHPSPAAVLARVNEYLHTIVTRRSMVTCCYMVLDHDRGTLRYATAGHPPPVIVEADGVPRFLDAGRGVPLGVIPTAAYTDAHYQLSDAATIVLYTDGLIERRGETIDVGLARLLQAIRGQHLDVNALCDHLIKTLLGANSEDDVALLAARVGAMPDPTRLHVELPADSRRLHELRTRVSRWLVEAGVEASVIPDVVVALNEAASNSMLHAYSGTRTRGRVRVSLALADRALWATVADEGRWRESREHHDGRGLEMMHALMTDVRVERDDGGTRVHLTRRIDL